jgi:hypothetical protein
MKMRIMSFFSFYKFILLLQFAHKIEKRESDKQTIIKAPFPQYKVDFKMKITSFPFLLTVLATVGLVNGTGNCAYDGGVPDDSKCSNPYEKCICSPGTGRKLRDTRKGRNTNKLSEAHDEAVGNANIASHNRRTLSGKACPSGNGECVPKTGKSAKNNVV